MTFRQALKIFRTEIVPDYRQLDATIVRCSFNDWIDSLHKDSCITDKQVQTWCYPERKSRNVKAQ